MSDHDSHGEMQAVAAQGGRSRWRDPYIATAIAGVAIVVVFAGSSAGHGHRMAQVQGLPAAAAPFNESWRRGLFDSMIEMVLEAHADRMVRHLSIEIDATAGQQEKLRAIVIGAIMDLMPVREKMMAARAAARDFLTRETDRAAIETFRADLIETHDTVSKRLVQAVADAAEVLTFEQRRRLSDMLPVPGGHFGSGPRESGPWDHSRWEQWGAWRN